MHRAAMIAALLIAIATSETTLPAQSPPIPIAIEARLANAAGLRVGDTVRVAADTGTGLLATIAAIYEPRADPATLMRRDFNVRLQLPDLAALLGRPERIDRVAIALQPGVNADSAATVLNRTAFGFQVYTSDSIASQSSTTFLVVARFHRAIAIISVLASAIFLLCLMVLKVEERRSDVAVLRLTGISRRTIFRALMIEATAIALAGSAIGVGIAAIASAITNWHYQRSFETALVFSLLEPRTIVFSVALSSALGVVAGAIAAARIVGTHPLILWRRA